MTKDNEGSSRDFSFLLDDKRVDIDVRAFRNHIDILNRLCDEYANVISPLIVEYEVEKNEFPVEILNEIRAIVGHVVRAAATKDDAEVSENIKKAHSHAKRATLDGYKYLCVTYDDRYWEFFSRYNNIDWISSGLQSDVFGIDEKHALAVSLLKQAKNSEGLQNDSQRGDSLGEEKLVNSSLLSTMYQRAYEEYRLLYRMLYELDSKMSQLSEAKKMVVKKKRSVLDVLGLKKDEAFT